MPPIIAEHKGGGRMVMACPTIVWSVHGNNQNNKQTNRQKETNAKTLFLYTPPFSAN